MTPTYKRSFLLYSLLPLYQSLSLDILDAVGGSDDVLAMEIDEVMKEHKKWFADQVNDIGNDNVLEALSVVVSHSAPVLGCEPDDLFNLLMGVLLASQAVEPEEEYSDGC